MTDQPRPETCSKCGARSHNGDDGLCWLCYTEDTPYRPVHGTPGAFHRWQARRLIQWNYWNPPEKDTA